MQLADGVALQWTNCGTNFAVIGYHSSRSSVRQPPDAHLSNDIFLPERRVNALTDSNIAFSTSRGTFTVPGVRRVPALVRLRCT